MLSVAGGLRGHDELPRTDDRGRGGKLRDLLLWQLEWGDKEEWLQDLAEEEGRALPALERKPEIPAYLYGVWETYTTLSASRSAGGMGSSGPIPLSEIRAYCGLYRIEDLDERDELVTFVRAMDQAYLEAVRKDQK